MRIGVPREIHPNERRVATTPEVVPRLIDLGYTVLLEAGAGEQASYTDEAYREAGAQVMADPELIWSQADIILKVRAPEHHPTLDVHESTLLREGQTLISFIWPGQNEALVEQLAARGANVLAMDSVPRISRAQKLDALSSMANIAGYRAVIEAATHFGRFFTGQVTAAGKVQPARVLIIGAGVAGLAAIGAANGLGAIVRAFDTRPEVGDQVRSMGAEFLELDFEEDASGEGGYAKVMSEEFIAAEMQLFREQADEVDIIITTALIPGKPAPRLILADMVERLRDGSVIVDLAAENGGNCELTEPGQVVERHGVTIIGYTDLPSRLPTQSSQLYATNLYNLLADMTPDKDGKLNIDMDDEVIRGTTVVEGGKVTWPPPPPKLSAAPATAESSAPQPVVKPVVDKKKRGYASVIGLAAILAFLLAVGTVAPPAFMAHLTVFVLAVFVGWQVIWAVTPALHTPLMSVTNAISGIIVIGALLQVGAGANLVVALSFVAVLIASINIAGGFLVTHRMLSMFRKGDEQ
ncbi:MAG: Re/Si-specific NAD(P)(+) transhydrogenase subunit alpha [Gammaproteobacteria bacterium]|nr:Re/Si-specific NAD(P)(+) transhydrogenase subunit alpha [Gammaproteobacteria bacterium]